VGVIAFVNDEEIIMKLSIISPVFKATETLSILVERIESSIVSITDNYEIILVDDGCPDNSWEKISEIAENNKNVKGIKLSRNFGQHYAITCGLENSNGDWVVVMDCDLQDVPEEIPNLYNKALEGYDVVLARRASRKDGFFKKLGSQLFYKLLSFFTDTKQDKSIANFGIYHRKVIASVLAMGDHIRVFPIMIQWVGFNKVAIDVKHSKREEGKSSYTISKLLKLAFDTFLTFSNKPLMLTIKFGLLISLVSFVLGMIYLYQYLSGAITVLGFTSIIISIWFLSGVVIFSIGILGLYIGKTFDASKNRPGFIVDEIINK
jgi:dolichol-phosphate mannosyltransferase